uniref:SusC/RagA family TonB-linked outer membrane protein n=1 Tax=Roseihalotalea indica TaxID=2867963 RepID=A0AA49GSY4_9BACT|nr:SusC/RagA family TonB-linked outer membrane protein [Tunicatimonas sp. TK19036]
MRYNSTQTTSSGNPLSLVKGIGCFLLAIILSTPVWAQDSTISGKVTAEEDGTALPGVNVIVKGTSQGTVTDIEGNYQISVPETAEILTFTFIGLEAKEVEINGQSVIDVTLSSDVKQLSEVVVTAIGIEREKKALGYAVSEVEGEVLQQRSEPDPVRALSGKVPGVNISGSGGGVGSATNITIRGNSSLLNNNQPLFVVDGVPFDNSVDRTGNDFQQGNPMSNRAFDLDPNTIESITVLKGASAAALYGSRAANGVIVITTKAGKTGSKKGLEVSYNGSFSLEEVAMTPDYQGVFAQGATYGSNNFVYNGGFFGTWGPPYYEINRQIQDGEITVPHPLKNKFGDPTTSSYAGDQYPEILENLTEVVPHTDNWKNFWDVGSLMEHSLQINSGGEKVSLTAGLSRTDNKGIIPFSELDRTSINFGGTTTLDNGLFVNGSVNYVRTNQRTAQQGAELIAGNSAGSSLIGMLYLLSPTYDLTNYPYVNRRTGGSIYYRNGYDNPYWVSEFAPITSSVDRSFGKAQVGYDLFDWMTVSYQIGFNAYTDRRSSLVPPGGENVPPGQYIIDDIYRREFDGVFLISIDKSLSADFNLQAQFGHNANERVFEQTTVLGNGIIDASITNIVNTSSQVMQRDIVSRRRFQGAFGNVSISYQDYLFLNVAARNDWSSTLPDGENSYFYPSVSLSGVVSEAIELPEVVSFAKIRGGIATVGNEASPYLTQTPFILNDTDVTTEYADLQFPFTNPDGTYNIANAKSTLGSPVLKPEFTTEYEIGAELAFLNSRIGLDVTYYNRQSTDQIAQIDVAPSTGYRSKVTNIGRVDNFGWEIGLDLTPVQLPNGLTWNIYAAFTRNRNVVKELGDLDQVILGGFSNLAIVHRPGQPFGQILGTDVLRWSAENGLGDPNGEVLVNAASGKPLTNPELQVIGDPNPDYLLGVTSTLGWKGIEFMFLIDYQHGGDMYSYSADQMQSRGALGNQTDRTPRLGPGIIGTTEGPTLDEDGNTIPNNVMIPANDWYFFDGWAAGGADWVSVYDRTTIRLREVSLSYRFPQGFLEKTPFGTARVSFSGRNLWYKAPNFPEALDFDPEVSGLGGGAAGTAQGFDFMGIPTTRRYGVNLSFTF